MPSHEIYRTILIVLSAKKPDDGHCLPKHVVFDYYEYNIELDIHSFVSDYIPSYQFIHTQQGWHTPKLHGNCAKQAVILQNETNIFCIRYEKQLH